MRERLIGTSHDSKSNVFITLFHERGNNRVERALMRGHRIWVSLILGLLSRGMSIDEVLAEYPGLEEADVRACLAYGARLAGDRFVDLP